MLKAFAQNVPFICKSTWIYKIYQSYSEFANVKLFNYLTLLHYKSSTYLKSMNLLWESIHFDRACHFWLVWSLFRTNFDYSCFLFVLVSNALYRLCFCTILNWNYHLNKVFRSQLFRILKPSSLRIISLKWRHRKSKVSHFLLSYILPG